LFTIAVVAAAAQDVEAPTRYSERAIPIILPAARPAAPSENIITTLAGADWLFSGDDQPALNSSLSQVEQLSTESDPGPVVEPSELIFQGAAGEPSPGSKTIQNLQSDPGSADLSLQRIHRGGKLAGIFAARCDADAGEAHARGGAAGDGEACARSLPGEPRIAVFGRNPAECPADI